MKKPHIPARIAAMLGFGSSGSTPPVLFTGETASGDAPNATPYFEPPEKTPNQSCFGALTEADVLWSAHR